MVDALGLEGLPEPAMHLAVLHDPRLPPGTPVDDIPQGTVRALVTDAATALHLAWSVRTLQPPEGEGPRNTLPLFEAIVGRQLRPRHFSSRCVSCVIWRSTGLRLPGSKSWPGSTRSSRWRSRAFRSRMRMGCSSCPGCGASS
ncbi:hypothetical protein [Sorangium sp. So ce861]|uniref:hypothetical protein n=1 Tax=Sorangium sp. So ce861 TaxID=3133323 RepID=UPI003F6096C4